MKYRHITPHDAERMLADVSHDKHFKLKIGAEIASLIELGEVLEIISDDTYNHHANAKKNDFARWVRDVFFDSELAEKLEKTGSKGKAAKIVRERVAFLNKRKHHGTPLYSHEWMIFGYRDFLAGLIMGIVVGYLLYYITVVWAY